MGTAGQEAALSSSLDASCGTCLPGYGFHFLASQSPHPAVPQFTHPYNSYAAPSSGLAVTVTGAFRSAPSSDRGSPGVSSEIYRVHPCDPGTWRQEDQKRRVTFFYTVSLRLAWDT